jgi:hypothetical protein
MNKDARLELLSDKVRKGIPIDLSEAIEVIDYQTKLRLYKEENSILAKLKRFIGRYK